MQAIRLCPNDGLTPYSPENPAPSSALKLVSNVLIPQPLRPGELLVQVRASAVVRDELKWPETYQKMHKIPGHDFAGIVISTFDGQGPFRPGDEVFGMTHADRGETWAEYAVVGTNETSLKPETMSWEEAAAMPLSVLTAYQALFIHGGLPTLPTNRPSISDHATVKQILITGACGGVGVYLVQLAKLAGLNISALTSSPESSSEFLMSLGADNIVVTSELESIGVKYEIVIDTVGGDTLKKCWNFVEVGGNLVSVDSSSYNFVEEHSKASIAKESINATWFIVQPSGADLRKLSALSKGSLLRAFVARRYPLKDASIAYDLGNTRYSERGKIVLIM